MKIKGLVLFLTVLSLTEISFAQDPFSNAGITIGGTSNWYWRIYRASSGSFNQSLLFAQTGSSSTENIRARLTQWGGLGLGTTTIGSNQMLAVAGDSYFGGSVSVGNGSNYLLVRDNVGGTNEIRSYGLNLEIETRNTTEDILFNTNNGANNLMIIKGNGRVGIGTGSPSNPFEVKSSSSGTNAAIESENDLSTSSYFYTGRSGNSGIINKTIIENAGGNEILLNPSGGNIGIGTLNPLSKLAVNGQIRATEVKVLADITVPDYVFEPDYELRTLKETKEYIEENRHLPEIPSASEIGENGIDLGDMNMRLLKKIEELTLYQIELLEKVEELQEKVEKLEKN